eukprot:6426159-Prymnesium_polylepis.1
MPPSGKHLKAVKAPDPLEILPHPMEGVRRLAARLGLSPSAEAPRPSDFCLQLAACSLHSWSCD